MSRSRSKIVWVAVAMLSLWTVSGCGGGGKAGPPLFPGKITLSPGTNTSVAQGAIISFTASAQTASGTNLAVTITFSSSDTSILNIAPNGVACAGHWDVGFTTCTPGGAGPVQVTASALGASSIPTWVFVHPPIDNITVSGVLLDGVPVQEPCLSQSQNMTVEAHAFSQGADITSSVGPFTWSANNSSVVTLTPLVNGAYNFPTNQATAKAVTPGITQIYASASGVSSSSFQQPQYKNSLGNSSPILDFFETCPIQRIALEVGASGSQQTGLTTFVTSKGTTQNATAVVTDLMGNSSLPNTTGGIVLSKIPLTWSASQPGVLAPSTGCQQSCALSTPLPGAGSVTASCSPPTCNIGFPVIPKSLSSPAALATCTQFFGINCQQLIPVPVYADGAISGVVTGTTSAAGVLATSTGCAKESPATCTTSIYSLATSTASTGVENPLPSSPNSLLFDLAGDKAFMGSDFGALVISPSNFGSSTNPYTGLSTVTGKVLASSANGNVAIFSDTIHIPNQVYIVNSGVSLSASALNISNAVAATFSPDGLKVFIVGDSGSSLYVYSSLQALQGPSPTTLQLALSGLGKAVAFSPNGAFAFVAEAANGGAANLTAFNTCDNNLSAPAVALPADPLLMKVLPGVHIEGRDSSGFAIPDGIHILVLDSTGFDVLTATISAPPAGSICPQTLTFVSGDPLNLAQRIELGQGPIQPVNFFASADASTLYVAIAGNASILIYDFGAGAVTSGIELLGNATPISAEMSVDAGTIVVGGNDGMLHELSTALGGSDLVQLSFPNVPDHLNPFCTFTPSQGPCKLNVVLVKP